MSEGSTVPHLNVADVRRFRVPVPPRIEQGRVASVLGALDDKIDSNGRLAAVLEETVATIFRARFVDFVGVEEFTDSEVGRVPYGWQVGVLSDLATIERRSVQPLATPHALFEHFGIHAFDDSRRAEIQSGDTFLSGKALLPAGDCILLSKLNPPTKRVWWPKPENVGSAICSPEFLVLVPRPGFSACYLYAVAMNDERFYAELLGRVSGTTGSRQRIKPSDALGCRVLLPDAVSLERWDAFARPICDHASSLLAESTKLEAIRDALLPKLISGEIRVPDTVDPGEVIGPVAEGVPA